MRIISIIVVLAFLILINCASGYNMDRGSVFQSYTLNKDVSTSTDLGTKEGKSCAVSFLSTVSVGDAGVKAAAESGGIKKVKAVDYSVSSFLGIYQSLCTIARGD